MNKKKTILIIIFAIILIILDQGLKIFATLNLSEPKVLIENFLNLEFTENTGGALGIGKDNVVMFIITNIIVIGIIIRFIILQKEHITNAKLFLLLLIIAGGISNLIDRVFKGGVIDYIKLFPNINSTIINLADIYIFVGWVLIVFVFALNTYQDIQKMKEEKRERKEKYEAKRVQDK